MSQKWITRYCIHSTWNIRLIMGNNKGSWWEWWEGMMGDDEGQQANIGEWLAMVGDNKGCQKNGKWWAKGEG